MKSAIVLSALATLILSRPLSRREVPQEHSHEKFLTTVRTNVEIDNPDGIVDPVFALLGNAAAAQGLGKLTDTECLQTATADRAFTNAKAASDVDGQVAALVYRTLERNSGKVGLATNSCTSFVPVNPEIAALSQHQDPASDNASAVNKAIELELAKQIATVGGDPQLALESATFAPGDKNDNTGKGNTCDTLDDPIGCGISQKLIVPQVTAAEITAAVAGVSAGSANTGSSNTGASDNNSAAAPPAEVDDCEDASPAKEPAAVPSAAAPAPAATSATASKGNAASGSLSLGDASCSDPAIAFGAGFNGRKATEFTFQPDDPAVFKHGEALNPGIVAQFICDRLNDQCKASAATVSACRTAQAAIDGRKGDASAATEFNNALGVSATKIGISSAAPAAGAAEPASNQGAGQAAQPASNQGAGQAAQPQSNQGAGQAAQPASQASGAATSNSGSASAFGSCSDPSIKFGKNADRPNENAFVASNQKDFNHGSALGINVISSFICQKLNDACKAGAATVSKCATAQAAANGKTGQAAADAFNSVLGV